MASRRAGNFTVTFRPIRPDDEDFLYRLYAGTREDELSVLEWDASQKETFLKMQFKAQHQYYQERFQRAEFQIILRDGRSIGRLYVDRRADEIRLIDIALLPEARNGGIGTSLMRDLLEEGAREEKPVRIHVERYNAARRLYERLGFSRIEDRGVYHLMEWSPNRARAALQA